MLRLGTDVAPLSGIDWVQSGYDMGKSVKRVRLMRVRLGSLQSSWNGVREQATAFVPLRLGERDFGLVSHGYV